jgi:hypothetical protein
LIDGVDSHNKEAYIHDNDFEKHFEMTRVSADLAATSQCCVYRALVLHSSQFHRLTPLVSHPLTMQEEYSKLPTYKKLLLKKGLGLF